MKANKKFMLPTDDKAMIQMLPTVAFAVIMLFAVLYIGTYINGTIGSQLISSFPATATDRTAIQNNSILTINNLSTDYDSIVEIVIVAAIIIVLTIPLMAVVALKRFF